MFPRYVQSHKQEPAGEITQRIPQYSVNDITQQIQQNTNANTDIPRRQSSPKTRNSQYSKPTSPKKQEYNHDNNEQHNFEHQIVVTTDLEDYQDNDALEEIHRSIRNEGYSRHNEGLSLRTEPHSCQHNQRHGSPSPQYTQQDRQRSPNRQQSPSYHDGRQRQAIPQNQNYKQNSGHQRNQAYRPLTHTHGHQTSYDLPHNTSKQHQPKYKLIQDSNHQGDITQQIYHDRTQEEDYPDAHVRYKSPEQYYNPSQSTDRGSRSPNRDILQDNAFRSSASNDSADMDGLRQEQEIELDQVELDFVDAGDQSNSNDEYYRAHHLSKIQELSMADDQIRQIQGQTFNRSETNSRDGFNRTSMSRSDRSVHDQSDKAAKLMQLESQIQELAADFRFESKPTIPPLPPSISSLRDVLKQEKELEVLTLKKELILQSERQLQAVQAAFNTEKQSMERQLKISHNRQEALNVEANSLGAEVQRLMQALSASEKQNRILSKNNEQLKQTIADQASQAERIQNLEEEKVHLNGIIQKFRLQQSDWENKCKSRVNDMDKLRGELSNTKMEIKQLLRSVYTDGDEDSKNALQELLGTYPKEFRIYAHIITTPIKEKCRTAYDRAVIKLKEEYTKSIERMRLKIRAEEETRAKKQKSHKDYDKRLEEMENRMNRTLQEYGARLGAGQGNIKQSSALREAVPRIAT